MATATVTSFTNAMKRYYSANDPRDTTYPRSPGFAMLRKNTKFIGENMPVTYKFAHNVGGTSASFIKAQARANTVQFAKLLTTRVKRYGVAHIENELILASMSSKGAFEAAGPAHTDGIIEELTNDLGRAIYQDVGGQRGKIASVTGTAPFLITLDVTEDVVNFEVGHILEGSSTDGSAGGSSTDDYILEVIAVSRTTGILDCTKLSGSDSPVAADFLFVDGDFGVAITGLAAWVPTTDAAVGTLFNFDRSVDPVRLGGNRFNGTTFSIEEGLQKGAAETARNGGKLSIGYLNPSDWVDLSFELQTKLIRDSVKSPDKATIGFNTIVLKTAAGDVNLVADRNCPLGNAWLMHHSACEFASLNQAPHMLKSMTQDSWIWESNADSIELRVGWYGNLIVRQPLDILRVTLPV